MLVLFLSLTCHFSVSLQKGTMLFFFCKGLYLAGAHTHYWQLKLLRALPSIRTRAFSIYFHNNLGNLVSWRTSTLQRLRFLENLPTISRSRTQVPPSHGCPFCHCCGFPSPWRTNAPVSSTGFGLAELFTELLSLDVTAGSGVIHQ